MAFALFTGAAHAQSNEDPNYIFDPTMSGSGGSNGGGTWDTGTTLDWYDSGAPGFGSPSNPPYFPGLPAVAGDTYFPAPTAPDPGSPSGTPDTNNANAEFNNVGGTVDVDGAVDPNLLEFNGSGTYTLNPDAMDGGSINFNLPASNTGYYGGGYGGGILVVNSGNVDINTAININADPNGNLGQTGFENTGSGVLTITSNVTFTGLTGGVGLNLESYGSGSIVFTGINETSGVGINTHGNVEFDGDANGSQLDSAYGPMLLDAGATDYTGLLGQSGDVLTNGAFTVSAVAYNGNSMNQFTRSGTFGGATADDSAFAGTIQNYYGIQHLVAAANGKVTFEAEINQEGQVHPTVIYNPDGSVNTPISNLTINETTEGVVSTGVVSLSNPSGQTYGERTSGSNSDVGTEVVAGTLLLMNTSGSATGDGADGTVNNTVQLDAGAALGGTGYTQQNVVAMAPATPGGATAIITPGDMTKDGVSSIGTLHLDNGLSALNGLTANFQLAGPSTTYDQVEISTQAVGTPTFALDLAGPITFNLSGTVDTADTYTLFYSAAGTAWDVASSFATTTITGVPTGYTAVESYDLDSGGKEELNVSFVPDIVAVPEPSTYAMMLGGLPLLGLCIRRKLA